MPLKGEGSDEPSELTLPHLSGRKRIGWFSDECLKDQCYPAQESRDSDLAVQGSWQTLCAVFEPDQAKLVIVFSDYLTRANKGYPLS